MTSSRNGLQYRGPAPPDAIATSNAVDGARCHKSGSAAAAALLSEKNAIRVAGCREANLKDAGDGGRQSVVGGRRA